jgi:hypothetical protein
VINRVAVTLLVSWVIPGAYAQPDPKALVKQSIDNYEKDWREALTWCYTQTDTVRVDDHNEVSVSEIMPLEGTPFERLLLKNGQKLTPEQSEKEERKYRKAAEERARETPEQRTARLAKYEKERQFIREIPEAYNFTLTGEEAVNGRPAWVIQLRPRPEFVPTMSHSALLKHIEGKLWIDKEDVQWAKAEANVVEPVSIGLILARIGDGTHITVEQTRITDNFWMPRKITIAGAAKVLLVHTKNLDENLVYGDYRRDAGEMAGDLKRSSNKPRQTYPRIPQDALAQAAGRPPVRSSSLQ